MKRLNYVIFFVEIILGFTFFNEILAAREIDAGSILRSHFGKVSSFDMIGTIDNPFILNSNMASDAVRDKSYQISKLRLYRQVRKDGTVNCRVEMYNSESRCFATIIQIKDDCYFINESNNCAFRCVKSTYIDIADSFYQPILDRELENCKYEVKDDFVLGENCWNILMSVPENMTNTKLQWLFGDLFWCKIHPDRPFVREYIIGKDSGMIYQKKSYNAEGRLLCSFGYSSYEANPIWDGKDYLFVRPEHIMGIVMSDEEAIASIKLFEHSLNKQSNARVLLNLRKWFSCVTEYISESLAQQICLLVGLGVILVGTGVWIRMKRK